MKVSSFRQASKLMASASSKIHEGVFAINKPADISSAQVLRDLQTHFDPSQTFASWLSAEKQRIEDEGSRNKKYQKRWRSKRKGIDNLSVKMGHGGTLDPIATGVLIAGVGAGTKSLNTFLSCTKTYETIVLFGVATDSYDRVGKVVGRKPFEHITKEAVEEALGKFRGKIMQRPPIFSALRIEGKRLYEYAREGKPLPKEIEKRPVEVKELKLLEWMEGGTHEYKWPDEEAGEDAKALAKELLQVPTSNDEIISSEAKVNNADNVPPATLKRKRSSTPEALARTDEETAGKLDPPYMSGALLSAEKEEQNPEQHTTYRLLQNISKQSEPPAAKIRMTVTSGFYVRSFCHDLGDSLGSLAIMADLVRTRQGHFEIGNNVLEYKELAKGEEVWGPQVRSMLNEWNMYSKAEHAKSSS